jgi:nucleolar MIF4G domain-containing protein 1
MLETINDLKNNRLKTGAAASAVTSEHIIQMKKMLGSLNTRSLRATEPLRIGLADIRDTEKKGKWWQAGASYKDAPELLTATKASESLGQDEDLLDDSATTSLLTLARAHRMNTDIRRAIFITLMSSTDYHDAHLRLSNLRLKRAQELEIPRVLLHCAGAEGGYNPYYTLIARKLCADKKLKMAFQFSLWDFFKRLGENRDEDDASYNEDDNDDENDEIQLRTIVNLGKLYGSLVSDGGMTLKALKVLNLVALGDKARVFVEVLLITLFLALGKSKERNESEEGIVAVFMAVKEEPALASGLQCFLKKVVAKTDIAGGEEELGIVKWGCRVARDALAVLGMSHSTRED